MGIVLRGTEALNLTLGGANSHDYHISYKTVSPGGEETLQATSGNLAAVDETAVVAASASADRKVVITGILIRNKTANATTLTWASKVTGGTARVLFPAISLGSGESAEWTPGYGWQIYLTAGNRKAPA
jgi:hypothetical protein